VDVLKEGEVVLAYGMRASFPVKDLFKGIRARKNGICEGGSAARLCSLPFSFAAVTQIAADLVGAVMGYSSHRGYVRVAGKLGISQRVGILEWGDGVMFLDGHKCVVQARPHKLGQIEFGGREALKVTDIVLVEGAITGGKFYVFFIVCSVVRVSVIVPHGNVI
jgi:hypothetical protein